MQTTLDDAIDALREPVDSADVRRALEFLNALKAMAKPSNIPTDYHGFIVDGAHQNGAEFIDDDAELLVMSEVDFIAYIAKREGK